jgi:uncharacterized protein (DUF1015 family)
MKRVHPFTGILFDNTKVDIQTAIAPPYDVFEENDGTDLNLRRHAHNIVHLQKPRQKDTVPAVKEAFYSLGYLSEDKEPGIYVYQQSWEGGSRLGAFCAVDLDAEGFVLQHEGIKRKPFLDRIENLKQSAMNIGPVFAFAKDDNGMIGESLDLVISTDAMRSFQTPDGQTHSVWKTIDPALLQAIDQEHGIYIADGHHRYNAMMNHHHVQDIEYGEGGHRYGLFYIVPQSSLSISSWHRVVDCSIDTDYFSSLLKNANFGFHLHNTEPGFVPDNPRDIGMHLNGNSYVLEPERVGELHSLDILHNWILEPLFGIDEEAQRNGAIAYIDGSKGPSEIIRQSRPDRAIFTLSPTPLEDVIYAANHGLTMPPKSTNFSPKVPTGIVMREIYR